MAKNSRPFVERDDLMLLMESYRNTIQLSTTLLEKQNVLIEKQNNLTELHRDVVRALGDVAKNLKDFSDKVIENNNETQKLIIEKTGQLKIRLYVTFIGVLSIIGTVATVLAAVLK